MTYNTWRTHMAYDASFLTGSDERSVDPIQTGFHHNDQEIADLNNEHIVIYTDDKLLTNALESFDSAGDIALQLNRSGRCGERMSTSTYKVLNTALKNIVRRTTVGFDPLPAMESLDSTTQRELTLVMENVVTETIKNIWEKIKSTFISMHNKIKSWFIKAFDGAGKLIKQAEALKAKADGMSTATARNTNFDMAGVKFLNMKGKLANPQEIGQGVQTISTITENLLGKNAESYNKMFVRIEDVLKKTIEQAKNMKDSNAKEELGADGKPKTNTSISEAFNGSIIDGKTGSVTNAAGSSVATNGETNKLLSGIFNDFIATAKSAGIDWANASAEIKGDQRWSEKVSAYRNPNDLLGSIMLVAAFPNAGVDTIESYSVFKEGFKISPEPIINPPKEIDDNGTFQTAPPALVINICESTITACKTLMNYKLLFEARDKNTGNLMKQMEQYVSANSTLKGAGEKHIQNSISTTVALVKKMQDGETRWAKYAFSVLNKAIVYCRNSLAQY